MNGWIKLYRQLNENPIWKINEPFDKRSAWIDLLLMVNHADKDIIVNGSPLTVHKGQKFTSIRKLSAKWGWSLNKVRRYLKMLKELEMVYTDDTHCGTLITIENWAKFQVDENTDEYTDEYTDDTSAIHGRNPNKNDIRMIKNEKEKEAAPDFDRWGNKLQ